VLEWMGGGDLLNLLIEQDLLDESTTKFYVAEVSPVMPEIPTSSSYKGSVKMILCIQECHRHGFIHRDIKPDVGQFLRAWRRTLMIVPKNFLFDKDGHVKLSDFGLA
jgi:protein-serine/threonine kinase